MGLSAAGTSPVVLHGTFSDPDGGTGSLKYTVYNGSGTQVYSGFGSVVSDGSDSPLSLPSGTLQSGYTWKAQGFDNVLYSASTIAQAYPPVALSGGVPWNIVMIMADDLDVDTLNAALNAGDCLHCAPEGGLMPNYYQYFVQQGVVFDNSFVSYSLCCPSRVSFLTGRYAHNTGVQSNMGQEGGCQAFTNDQETIAAWLHQVTPQPYTTGLIGKYLNGYGTYPGTDQCHSQYIPHTGQRDWDYWHSLLYVQNHDASYERGYWMNENNTKLYKDDPTGPNGFYQVNKISADAASFVGKATEPYFLDVVPSAPHLDRGATVYDPYCMYDTNHQPGPGPWYWGDVPTIRDDPFYAGWADDLNFTQKANSNEDTTDKPSFLKPVALDIANDTCVEDLWRDRIVSLVSIDNMIGNIVNTIISRDGDLSKTVLIFTSDNGFFNGEHRLHGKIGPYEESIRVPLAIRYPDSYWSGSTVHDLVLNHDLAPTIADLAGGPVPQPSSGFGVDGQSLYSLLANGTPLPRLRFLVEHWPPDCPPTGCTELPDVTANEDFYPQFVGIRTGPGGGTGRLDPPYVLYMQYNVTTPYEYEYYSGLDSNASQITNECTTTQTCPDTINSQLKTFLTDLQSCDANAGTGHTCQDLENADLPP